MPKDFKVVTPLIKLNSFKNNDTYIKLEGSNLYGSVKDRAVVYVLSKLLEEGIINRDIEIVEISSGNMGVALVAHLKLNITIMIDASTSNLNEFLIKAYDAKMIKVTEADENRSYLKKRLQTVREYIAERDNVYWFNQYGNPLVIQAYKETVGKEIIQQYPDVEDSKVFEPETKKIKHFASIRTGNFLRAIIDDNIIASEHDSVQALFSMMREKQLFLGSFSGCIVTGTEQYLQLHKIANKKIVIVSHDCYFANLYSKHPEFMD
jgi:cysteine synthase